MVCAGSDGHNVASQTARVAQGWRLKQVQPPLIICTYAQKIEEILAEKSIPEELLFRCRDLGAAMGEGLSKAANACFLRVVNFSLHPQRMTAIRPLS